MAGKGEKAEDKLREITECSICMSAFTDPRMLLCVHTFCFECLKHTAEATQKKPGDKMPCPLCRKEVVILEDGINGVQKNFFIENLLEYKTMLKMGSNTIVCDICNITNESKTGNMPKATMKCLECKEHYCDSCVKVHQFQKVTKDHQLVIIGSDDMKSERTRITSTKTCTKHIQKLLDYYCADCKKIVCVSCFIERHASHKCCDVTSVDEEFRQKIERKSSKISTYMNEILFMRNKNEKRKLDFLTEIAEKEKEIHKRNTELKEMIDQHTKLLFDELSVIKSKHIKEMETEMEEIERFCSIFASFGSYCTELTLKGSASDICSSVDELIARADDLERDHETFTCRPHQSLEVSFHATDLGNVLQNANSNFVGHVEAKIETKSLYRNFAVAVVTDFSDTEDIVKINLDQPNDITTLKRIPTTMTEEAVAAVYNNTMYFAGIGDAYNEIWKYNQTSGWLICASLVQGRIQHSAAFINEALFTCGGFVRSSKLVLDSVEAFNAVSNKSTAVGKLVHAVHSTGNCIPYKGSLYILGGVDEDHKIVSYVQVYNTKENTCTLVLRSMPRPHCMMRGILWETSVILLGERTCFIFNIETETWQERKQFKTDTHYFGLVPENEKLFVIGGIDVDWQYRDDVHYVPLQNIIDNKMIAWKSHGKLPNPSSVGACAIMSFLT